MINFVIPQEQCFEQLYKFAERPDWKKGMRVWKETFSYPEEPIRKMVPLKNDYCQPRPEVDLKKIKLSSEILENLPNGVIPEHLRQDREPTVPEEVPANDNSKSFPEFSFHFHLVIIIIIISAHDMGLDINMDLGKSKLTR